MERKQGVKRRLTEPALARLGRGERVVALLWILSVPVIIGGGFALLHYHTRLSLVEKGVPIQGHILDKDFGWRWRPFGLQYFVIISYQVAEKERSYEADVVRDRFASIQTNVPVSLWYDPQDPERCLSELERKEIGAVQPLILGSLGVLGMLIVLLSISSNGVRRSAVHLLTTGVVVDVRIGPRILRDRAWVEFELFGKSHRIEAEILSDAPFEIQPRKELRVPADAVAFVDPESPRNAVVAPRSWIAKDSP